MNISWLKSLLGMTLLMSAIFGTDIQKGSEIILGLIGAVHAVVDGNETNAILREGALRIEACTEVITTCSTEVFYQHNVHLTGFNVGNQAVPVWALKIAARPSIVRIVDDGWSRCCA